MDEPLLTTETVLAEVCHRLVRARAALQIVTLMIAEGRLVIAPVLAENPERVADLLNRYAEMDLGDGTLVALSERIPQARQVTLDRRDFSRYRRADGAPVPSIMPAA